MNDDNIEELTRIAAEQRREFMAAGAVESDLELAYRLQLEEAMAASLSIQPSSSNPLLQPPQPPYPISIDDGVNLADLQTLEFQKFETEINDRMIIEAEAKKLQVDLNRRIHDQKLAREIVQMPEDQWIVVGDNFERPYGEGSSKDNTEVFRVYFKGLLSEERVQSPNSSNKTVTIGGIGVAICDSKDEMIFEVSKPLDMSKDDQMSRRNVEGQALIEALNAAAALDIKRIVFYCDYYPLFQYVSGRWRPKQQKVITFLNKVNLFRKCFTYCEPSLIASKDVKFAFKLAREAIGSQTSKVVSSQEKLESCVICFDDKSIDQFFSIEGCSCTHRYCYSCVKQHVEVKLLNGVLPKCPHEGCENELRIESCEKFLNQKFTEMMRQRVKEDSIPVTEKVYCPYPKCSTLMSKTEILRLPRLINEIGAITCYKCHGNFCISCSVPWHENMNCAEYKQRNPTLIVEESNLKNLAARNLWRQCIKCKHMIELAAGCYHMTCRCGYEFCYTCGAEWKNKKATCTCPLWHEENIIDAEEEEDDDDDFGHGVVHEDNDFGHGVVLEDDDFGHDVVLEDDDFEDDDFAHDVLEDDDFEDDDFGHDVLEDDDFEDDDFGHDALEDDAFEDDDFGHDVVLEDDVFEDGFEHDAVLEDGDFEGDVLEEEEEDGDYFEDDDVEDNADDVLEEEDEEEDKDGDDFEDDDVEDNMDDVFEEEEEEGDDGYAFEDEDDFEDDQDVEDDDDDDYYF